MRILKFNIYVEFKLLKIDIYVKFVFRKINICEELFEYIKKCFAEKQPLGQALHRKVMNLFRQYLIIGGMPKVVDTFRKTKDFEKV